MTPDQLETAISCIPEGELVYIRYAQIPDDEYLALVSDCDSGSLLLTHVHKTRLEYYFETAGTASAESISSLRGSGIGATDAKLTSIAHDELKQLLKDRDYFPQQG